MRGAYITLIPARGRKLRRRRFVRYPAAASITLIPARGRKPKRSPTFISLICSYITLIPARGRKRCRCTINREVVVYITLIPARGLKLKLFRGHGVFVSELHYQIPRKGTETIPGPPSFRSGDRPSFITKFPARGRKPVI